MKKIFLLVVCMFCLFGCAKSSTNVKTTTKSSTNVKTTTKSSTTLATTTKDIAKVQKMSYEVNHYKQNLE